MIDLSLLQSGLNAAAPEGVKMLQVEEFFLIDASQSGIKTASSRRAECSVMMAFSWQGALLLILAATLSVYAGNVAAVYHLNLNIYGWKHERFVWCPSQT